MAKGISANSFGLGPDLAINEIGMDGTLKVKYIGEFAMNWRTAGASYSVGDTIFDNTFIVTCIKAGTTDVSNKWGPVEAAEWSDENTFADGTVIWKKLTRTASDGVWRSDQKEYEVGAVLLLDGSVSDTVKVYQVVGIEGDDVSLGPDTGIEIPGSGGEQGGGSGTGPEIVKQELIIFPCSKVKWDSVKTPDFNTSSVYLGRGRRKSITNRYYPKWTIKVQFVGLSQREYEEIISFLCRVAGGAFLWLDHEDYCQYNVKLTAKGTSKTDFQLVRCWGRFNTFSEPVTDIVPDSLRVYAGGILVNDYTLKDNGIISFASAPDGQVQADFIYYWRVALDDSIDFSAVYKNLYETGSIKFISV